MPGAIRILALSGAASIAAWIVGKSCGTWIKGSSVVKPSCVGDGQSCASRTDDPLVGALSLITGVAGIPNLAMRAITQARSIQEHLIISYTSSDPLLLILACRTDLFRLRALLLRRIPPQGLQHSSHTLYIATTEPRSAFDCIRWVFTKQVREALSNCLLFTWCQVSTSLQDPSPFYLTVHCPDNHDHCISYWN